MISQRFFSAAPHFVSRQAFHARKVLRQLSLIEELFGFASSLLGLSAAGSKMDCPATRHVRIQGKRMIYFLLGAFD